MGRDFLYGLESRNAQSRSCLAIYSCFIDFAAFRYLRTHFPRVVFRDWTLDLADHGHRRRAGRLELAILSVAQRLYRSPLLRQTGADPWRCVLCGREVAGCLQRASHRFLAMLRSNLDAVGGNEFAIVDADKAEHPTQIGFEMLADRGGRAGAIKAAARDRDEDALVAGQPLDALGAVFEGFARDQDPIDP